MLDAQESRRISECAPGMAQEVVGDSLGYGNIYYALARHLRPRHALVIGSGAGFTPAIIAGLLDYWLRGRR